VFIARHPRFAQLDVSHPTSSKAKQKPQTTSFTKTIPLRKLSKSSENSLKQTRCTTKMLSISKASWYSPGSEEWESKKQRFCQAHVRSLFEMTEIVKLHYAP